MSNIIPKYFIAHNISMIYSFISQMLQQGDNMLPSNYLDIDGKKVNGFKPFIIQINQEKQEKRISDNSFLELSTNSGNQLTSRWNAQQGLFSMREQNFRKQKTQKSMERDETCMSLKDFYDKHCKGSQQNKKTLFKSQFEPVIFPDYSS